MRTVRMSVSTAPDGCAREKMRGTRRRREALCDVVVSTMRASSRPLWLLKPTVLSRWRFCTLDDRSWRTVVALDRASARLPGAHAALDVRCGIVRLVQG